MGCVCSKKSLTRRTAKKSPDSSPDLIVQSTHDIDWTLKSSSGSFSKAGFSGTLDKIKEEPEKENDDDKKLLVSQNQKSGNLSKPQGSGRSSSFSIRNGGRFTQGENVAAGWPPWLCAVASEAVEGWVPLKYDRFEKLEKIGQGTYSSVWRALDTETGKMVALKKVRFDNFTPESVRFMAREITILRRLDHINIMKLEGIIASKLSCSIYLVFEYMEHDLAGLLSCPDIKFTEAQIKCFMRQLLCGLEHCHSQGIVHRDVKTSNILVNNDGILKIADFGLANFTAPYNKEPLTTRVVTLWYRPPELLLGSTKYGVSVDLWSVGCVFAELFTGKPFLKGKTEVEQLHKIFRLCGTPTEEYWRRYKLPLATMFKPQHRYESMLRERCKEFPETSQHLIESFLSIEPHKRGTATAALNSEYFNSTPYACDPSSLPKYPPNKEIDAKLREEERRKNASRMRASGPLRNSVGASRNSSRERQPLQESTTSEQKQEKGSRDSLNSDSASEVSQVTEMSQSNRTLSVPVASESRDKRQKQDSASSISHGRKTLKAQTSSADQNAMQNNIEHLSEEKPPLRHRVNSSKRSMKREQVRPQQQNSLAWSDIDTPGNSYGERNAEMKGRSSFSGPLTQSSRKRGSQDGHTRQSANHPSRFHRGTFYIKMKSQAFIIFRMSRK
nr:PREDICTED: probable serine/threonine-protein kinase At1g54610 isoform X1 [Daucus carota subsp. sativus]